MLNALFLPIISLEMISFLPDYCILQTIYCQSHRQCDNVNSVLNITLKEGTHYFNGMGNGQNMLLGECSCGSYAYKKYCWRLKKEKNNSCRNFCIRIREWMTEMQWCAITLFQCVMQMYVNKWDKASCLLWVRKVRSAILPLVD